MIDEFRELYAAVDQLIRASGLGGGIWTVVLAQFFVTRLAISLTQAVLLALRFAGDLLAMKIARIRTAPDDLYLLRVAVLTRLRYEAWTRLWRRPSAGFGPDALARRPQPFFLPRRARPERSVAGWLIAAAYPAMSATAGVVAEIARGLVGVNAPNVLALALVAGFGHGRDLLQAALRLLTGAAGPTPQAWLGFVLVVLAVFSVLLSMTKIADVRGVNEYGKQATAQAYNVLARLLPVAHDLGTGAWHLAEDLLDPGVQTEIVEQHRQVLLEAWRRGREAVEETAAAYELRFQLLRTAPPRARFLLEQLLHPEDAMSLAIAAMRRPAAHERTMIRLDRPGAAVLRHSAHEPVLPAAQEQHRRWIRALVRIDVAAREYLVVVERRLNPGPVRRLLHLTSK